MPLFFLGSKVADKERLHPRNHARVKDEISSVRFLVRINHYVRKEKQIFSVNSVLEMNGCAACMLMRVSRGGEGGLNGRVESSVEKILAHHAECG